MAAQQSEAQGPTGQQHIANPILFGCFGGSCPQHHHPSPSCDSQGGGRRRRTPDRGLRCSAPGGWRRQGRRPAGKAHAHRARSQAEAGPGASRRRQDWAASRQARRTAGGLRAALLSGWAGARPRRRPRCAARPPAGASAQRPTEPARYDSIFDFYFS